MHRVVIIRYLSILLCLVAFPSMLLSQEKPNSYEETFGSAGAACSTGENQSIERFSNPSFSEIDTSEIVPGSSEPESCIGKSGALTGDPSQYQTTRDCDDQVVTVKCCDSIGKANEGFGGSTTVWVSPFGNPYSERCEVLVSQDVCASLGINGASVQTQAQWDDYIHGDRNWGKKFKALATLMHEIRGHCLDLCYNYPTNMSSSESHAYCMSAAYCTRKMKDVNCEKILKERKPPDKYRLCLDLLEWQVFNHVYSKFNFCLSKLGEINLEDCQKCLNECKREFPGHEDECQRAYQSHCPVR